MSDFVHPDKINALYQSTVNLHERFGIDLPAPIAVQRVFEEEVRELIEASHEVDQGVAGAQQHMAEEAADVFVTVLALCWSQGISLEDIEQAVSKVVTKNAAKTWETHHINETGKIARRKAL